ncbi:hypothetical protein J7K56_04135 [Candidatus Calescamantes bacterium]|nr:hypothetical protein [Candidatus Calescamantes bacterium]
MERIVKMSVGLVLGIFLVCSVYGEVPQLDFRNKFYASTWVLKGGRWGGGKPIKMFSDVKNVLDNYFNKLGVDYVWLAGFNRPQTKDLFYKILDYCREKGYPVGLVGWDLETLKYVYKNYPDVVQLLLISESWGGRADFIHATKIRIPLGFRRYSEWIPLQKLGFPYEKLENTYTGLSWAMENTLGKRLEQIYKVNPKIKILVANQWDMPDINSLLKHDYAKNLILCKKSFGWVDIQCYEDLVKEGKIAGWGVALSSDGSPIVSFTPQHLEILLKKAIVSGARTWELQDHAYLRTYFDDATSPNATLNEWGKAFKEAIEMGHKYNATSYCLDTGIAILRYPNECYFGNTVFNMLRVVEANRFFNGDATPICADNPFIMHGVRWPGWGIRLYASRYTPPYDGPPLRYFDPQKFLYTTCITPKTKVVILVGPGNMDKATVDKLSNFCRKGGYVIQSAGAYLHDPETGKEMLEFEKLEYYEKEPKKVFLYPSPSQIRPLFERFSGFKYESTGMSKYYFKCKVIDKTTPLVPFDYSTEYYGCGNSFVRFYFLKGKLQDGTKEVVRLYTKKPRGPDMFPSPEDGPSYPLLIFHPIGKGGVYTVLSWSLGGMTADWFREFIMKWMQYLVKKYGPNILERETVNIYDYEIYAGRLLNWEGKPYIEIGKDQKVGIVKNYLDKPIERVFLIHLNKDEIVLRKIFNKQGRICSEKMIKTKRGDVVKLKVKLKPGEKVVLEKLKK